MTAKKKAAANADGRAGVKAWLDGVPTEQRRLARRIDALILAAIPGAVSGIKYRKPSAPLGVPFYGLPETGWIAFVNSLKGRLRITFYAAGALKPKPPIVAPGGARAIDIAADGELDEKQIAAWLREAMKHKGWGQVS